MKIIRIKPTSQLDFATTNLRTRLQQDSFKAPIKLQVENTYSILKQLMEMLKNNFNYKNS